MGGGRGWERLYLVVHFDQADLELLWVRPPMKQLNLFGFADRFEPHEASLRDESTAWWLPLLRGPRVLWDTTKSASVLDRATVPEQPRIFPEQ